MHIRQISIFLQNEPGQLSRICRDLADAGINIATLSLADTTDFGIVRMIVDDHEKAKETLAAKGHAAKVSEVLAVCVPDRPGGMAEVMAALDKAGVNIEYSYAFAFHKAESALRAGGFTTLAESEIGEE